MVDSKRSPIWQRRRVEAALVLIAARPDVFVHQGAVVATWRRSGDRRFGPYYSLSYREGRRCREIYLGREGADVDQVRQALAALCRQRQARRTLEDVRRQVTAGLRTQRKTLGARLRPLGLRLHGVEIRGWRPY